MNARKIALSVALTLAVGSLRADVIDVSTLERPSSTNAVYTVPPGSTVRNVPEGFAVTDTEGNPVTMQLDSETTAFCGVPEGKSVTLDGLDAAWRSSVVLWIDPSDDTAVFRAAKTNGTIEKQDVDGKKYDLVWGLSDVRPSFTTYKFWNGRAWMRGYYESSKIVFPYLVSTNGLNGRAFLSFGTFSETTGTSRRLYVNTTVDVAGYADVTNNVLDTDAAFTITNSYGKTAALASAKFAVFVFGSGYGGGGSIFKDAEGTFDRAGHDRSNGMVNNPSIDVWVNGQKIADPSATGFTGGWDVISMDLSASPNGVTGIGIVGGGAGNGGQEFGEIIFLDHVPTEAERCDAERYLARRWGLDGKYVDVKQARLAGEGTVIVAKENNALLSGVFGGVLSVPSGATVAFQAYKPAYTEAQVGALAPALWIDPSAPGALIMTTDKVSHTNTVCAIYQHDADKRTDEDIVLTGGGTINEPTARVPGVFRESRLLGPSLPWVDFNGDDEESYVSAWLEKYAREGKNNDKVHGNTFRIRTFATRRASSGDDIQVNTRTGFIVQDSSRGGGTPFSESINYKTYSRMVSTWSASIFPDKATNILKNGATYLNGHAALSSAGFTGRAEVFTFVPTDLYPVGEFANYSNSSFNNSGTDPVHKRNGEIQGEIVLFRTELQDVDRRGVEAYLMQKWLGFVPDGYSDFTGATITGAGRVCIPSALAMPKVSSEFSGTLSLAESAFAFTYENGVVTNPVICNGVLEVASPVILSVDFKSSVKGGSYRLLKFASMPQGLDLSLELKGESTLVAKAKKLNARLIVNEAEGSVDLKVDIPGLVLVVK